jgi:hypothetical protein
MTRTTSFTSTTTSPPAATKEGTRACVASSTPATSRSTGSSRTRRTPAGRHQDDGRGGEIQTELLLSCDALLLGRRTYDGFVPVWTAMSGDPYSDHINAMEKWVVSNTLTNPGMAQLRRNQRGRGRGGRPAQDPERRRHRAIRLRARDRPTPDPRPAGRTTALGAPLHARLRQPQRPAIPRRTRRTLRHATGIRHVVLTYHDDR